MDYLPNEILLKIFSYVPLKLCIRRTCRKYWNLYDNDDMSLYPLCSNLDNIILAENMCMIFTSDVYTYAVIMDLPILIMRHIDKLFRESSEYCNRLLKISCHNKSQTVATVLMKKLCGAEFNSGMHQVVANNLEKTFADFTHIDSLNNNPELLSDLSCILALNGYSTNICADRRSSNSVIDISWKLKHKFMIPAIVAMLIVDCRHNVLQQVTETYSLNNIIYYVVAAGQPDTLEYVEKHTHTDIDLYEIGTKAVQFGKICFIRWIMNHDKWNDVRDTNRIWLITKSLEMNRFYIFKVLYENCGFAEQDIHKWTIGTPLKKLASLWIHSVDEPEIKESTIEVYLRSKLS